MIRAYVGQTRSAKLMARLTREGIGEVTQRGECPPRRSPGFFDNGAFGDHRAGRPFDAAQYRADLETLGAAGTPLDFLVAPDRVAGGLDSLRMSLAWVPRLHALGPLYLVVQDGMELDDVRSALDPFAGIFLGGSLAWRLATARAWSDLAHAHGRRFHIGRAGTARKARWARRMGADSLDSCVPLFSDDNLRRWLAALKDTQMELLT